MKPQVQVLVEVTDEITVTNSGKQQQVVYVHLGDKYPVKDTIWVETAQLQPGKYFATRFYRRKYDFVLDLAKLTPATAAKAS